MQKFYEFLFSYKYILQTIKLSNILETSKEKTTFFQSYYYFFYILIYYIRKQYFSKISILITNLSLKYNPFYFFKQITYSFLPLLFCFCLYNQKYRSILFIFIYQIFYKYYICTVV